MKNYTRIALLLLMMSCATKDKYDVATYLNADDRKEVLASIITNIYEAPTYVSMKDRFKPEHRDFYRELTSRFSIHKFFVAENGTHYFLVLRPAPREGEKRGVGGYFNIGKNFELTGFREVFVTPILPEEEVKTKATFLFDKMVKGEVEEYLKMKSYVQWPNSASEYDTAKHEWVLIPNVLEK